MPTNKYCKDCGNNMRDSHLSPFCKASKTVDLVSGNDEYSRCRTMRLPRAACGIGAKLFVSKLVKNGEDIKA